ncbi:AraC family transcriptional regulator [Leptospira sarikeiensis]|uniref:AraC family transcriptional regulator n=1 Tax=Leptospira sarikeiensis TaxID=2484943 RepID=A0A4R9K1J6_9LEPT|nr:AraC family transcriptional regulator [Leptospira sarikeiensis]
MNHYDKIDSALRFIEKNLKNNITVKDVSDNSFSSLWHFQRIFRYMTGHSVYSYIRKRRLSEAAQKLILTKSKIIDIALEFQYEAPETFLREFKKEYGTLPSDYRNSEEHLIFEKINIQEEKYRSVYEGVGIEFKPVIRNSSVLIGKTYKTSMQKDKSVSDIPRIWEESYANGIFDQIPNRKDTHTVQGVYSNWDLDENFDFFVGAEVDSETLPISGFTKQVLPASKYMLFTVPGNTMEKLLNAWKYIYGTWLPNSEYERGSEDDFDVFDERFWDPKNPVSDIYISIL